VTPSSGELPSGLVTFVFTDIEGSTRLFRQHPAAYPQALAEHRTVLRSSWAPFGGVEVSTEGDGTLVAFQDASSAVAACAAAQQALATSTWPGGLTVRVRMGAHTGLAHPLDGDYVSLAVHQAARVAAAANGRQVLVSESTASLAESSGVELTDRGLYRVRDFDEPTRLFQVVVPGVDAPLTAPRAIPAAHSNVRAPTTAIIGRDDDVEALENLLAPGRLVSLVGPGGVGKSRVAAEVVERVAPSWPDGAWRVEVDDISDPSALLPAVADVLAVPLTSQSPADDLVMGLTGQRLLLLLDGSELLLDEVAVLVEHIRGRCPGVGLLITGREPLHLPGEAVRRLAPLPTEGATTPPAVTLLLERARLVNPDFASGPGDEAVVRELARRLDGLPLALEVAAGFSTAFTPAQMIAGLDAGTMHLQSRQRSLPARQRSLEALLTWSEQSLSAGERATLRRLSVLAGPFSLAAAQQVAAGDDVSQSDVLDHVFSLVDRSLLMTDNSLGSRYRMLELVRTFAAVRLAEAGESMPAWRRGADWVVAAIGPQQWYDPDWYGRASAEATVLRGLITRSPESDADCRRGALLGVVLARVNDSAQTYRTGSDEVASCADRFTAPSPERVALLAWVAWLDVQAGHSARADAWAAEASELRDKVGAPRWDQVGVERALGDAAVRRGEAAAALALADDALRRNLEPRARARMHNMRSIALLEMRDVPGALKAAEATLAACEDLGDPVLLAAAAGNVAETAFRAGHTARAARHEARALTLAEALGQPVALAYALNLTGRMVLGAPDREDAGVAVALLTRASAMLADAGQALYPEDDAATSAALREALRSLGPQEYRAAERDGDAMAVDMALRCATDVLGRLAD
jgi:predicted ATPase/class 3 adenylate cyclase